MEENNYLVWPNSVIGIIIILQDLLIEQLLTLDFKDINYLPYTIL